MSGRGEGRLRRRLEKSLWAAALGAALGSRARIAVAVLWEPVKGRPAKEPGSNRDLLTFDLPRAIPIDHGGGMPSCARMRRM